MNTIAVQICKPPGPWINYWTAPHPWAARDTPAATWAAALRVAAEATELHQFTPRIVVYHTASTDVCTPPADATELFLNKGLDDAVTKALNSSADRPEQPESGSGTP